MTPYAEALETQLALAAALDSPHGRHLVTDLLTAAGDRPERLREDADFITTVLRYAECFYWDHDLASAVAAASVGLRDWALEPSVLPATCGFFWLARPIALAGMLRPLRAAAWMGTVYDPSVAPDRMGAYRPIRIEEIDGARVIFFSEPEVGGLPWPTAVIHVGSGASIDGVKREATASKLRWFGAALAFMGQRIVVGRLERPDRAARRRLEKRGIEHVPLLRVVELRRAAGVVRPADAAVREVAWSCRWVVRGHWRQQLLASRRVNRSIWVTPHLKGPPDKPLKPPRATVFAVVR